MELLDTQTIVAVSGLIGAVGGAWITIHTIREKMEKARQRRDAKLLQEAKEEISVAKTNLEHQINALKAEHENLKENIDKDIQHIRETYNGEIRNLGQKIEDLRSELRNQHGQLVQLLSKMIEGRE